MGLFGWHRCREPGCAVTLFIPLFEKDKPDSKWWQEYLTEKARWHFPDGPERPTEPGARCPEHKPSGDALDSGVRRT